MEIHGAAVRGLRKARGLGLRATADAIGIDNAHLSRVETGRKGGLRKEVAVKLADLLEVPLGAIERREGVGVDDIRPDDVLLTAAEVGKMVKLQPETVLRHARKGLIQTTPVGSRTVRFSRAAAAEYAGAKAR